MIYRRMSGVLSLGQAIGIPGTDWVTSSSNLWSLQTTEYRIDPNLNPDPDTLALIAKPARYGLARLDTTIPGPGVFKFWWKGNHKSNDRFEFLLNGEVVASLEPSSPWTQETIPIPAGVNVIAIELYRDYHSSISGFLDDMSFTPELITFAQWAEDAGLGETDAEPHASPFNDASSNLLKYAFGMDGNRADHRQISRELYSYGLPTYQVRANDEGGVS